MEILLYNLIHWLGCTLPWENCLNNPKDVEASKIKYMDTDLLSTCFEKQKPPSKYLQLVFKLIYKYNRKGVKDVSECCNY